MSTPTPYMIMNEFTKALKAMPTGISKESDQVKDLLSAKYLLRVKFSQQKNSVTSNVWANKECIMWRERKNGPVHFGNGVTVIFGTPTKVGGSNNYPSPYFEEGYCILEWESKGFPHIAEYTNWDIEFLSLERINEINS